jgi:hypothetical protein
MSTSLYIARIDIKNVLAYLDDVFSWVEQTFRVKEGFDLFH